MGFRNSSGGGAGFTLGPAQNIFVGDTLAAAESARDTYFSSNQSNLAVYNGDTSLNIRLEYTVGSVATATYQVRNSTGDDWLVNESFEAVQGQPGTDGVDGTALEFTDEASRDTFFQARPNLLRNGLPINVGMGDDVVTIQIWTGTSNPNSYDPATQSILFIPASLRTSTGSLELGGAHTISSGNENVFVRNEMSNVAFFPTWQAIGDHSDPATRTVSNRPLAREYGEFQTEETGGPARATGVVPYNVDVTLTRNESVHGIRVIPAETYEGIAEYRITRLPEEVVVYNQRIEASVTPDVPFELWFSTPVDSQSGTQFRAEIIKIDGTNGLVRPTQDDDDPYVEVRFRTYEDVDVALLSEVGEENVQPDWNETDTNSDAFILNKPVIPADTNDFVDDLTATVSGQDLTITLGRTGALADLTQTVTLPGGSTPPADGPDTLYYGLSSSNNPATVDLSTLTGPVDATDPQTVTTGVAAQNDYFMILSANTHDITAITDTVLSQPVLDIFTKTEDVRTEGAVTYDSYVIGPLNADLDESYVLEF
ncbi:hypothetical protein VPHD63_0008 [Vibrio phage D63]